MSEKRIIMPEHFPWLDYRRYTFSMGVEKGGYIFLSGESASQYDPELGRVVCKGNVVDHARLAYEKLKVVLEAAGCSMDDVVKTVDYVTPQALEDYRGTADVRREVFKGNWPTATGIMVERLLRSDGLIEIDAIAVPGKKKEAINPGWPRYDRLTYHPAVRAGDLMCLSGFVGYRPEQGTSFPEHPRDTAAGQAANIAETVGALLKSAGATSQDLVKSMDYLVPKGMADYDSTLKARRPLYGEFTPASTGVVMNRLLPPDAFLEVETAAVLGGQRQEIRIPGWSDSHGPHGVRKGNLLYFSHQTGIDHTSGKVVEGDVLDQTRQAYRNMQRVVEAAGGTMGDVVKTIEFILMPTLEKYRGVADVRREFFGESFPAATGVVVNSIIEPGVLIQVDAIAVLD